MFKKIGLFTIVLLAVIQVGFADQPPNLVPLPKPVQVIPTLSTPTAPSLDAHGYILIDANSGKIIASANQDQRMEPASLTKLMSLYVISNALQNDRLKLTDLVNISENAWHTGGSRMFVKVNTQVSVRDLIQGIIVASGNDACVAMAEHIGGSEDAFATMMNQQAAALGMNNSHFMDSNGLPNANHYTTPRDLAILARALIQHFPNNYPWYKQQWFTYNGIKQPNRNRLLWLDNSVDGLKTGHTDGAGFCLVASAERHGMRLIAVVMGAPSDNARAVAAQKLLNYGYNFFETHKLYSADTTLLTPRIWKGELTKIDMGIKHDLYVTVPTGQFHKISAEIKPDGILVAPISKGKAYGTISVQLDHKPYVTLPLVALADDPKGGFVRRMWDSLSLSCHRVFISKNY